MKQHAPHFHLLCLFLCMLLLPLTPLAQETESTGEDDPEIDPSFFEDGDEGLYETVVSGYRIYATDEGTGFAHTIDVSQETTTLTSVSDVLSSSVGVQVQSTGGIGAYSIPSIRGSTPQQVPIFLDGIELNTGGFAAVNLADLSLDTLATIEVYRGSAPLILGTSGIGGAVVLKTRRFKEPRTEMAGTYGSWRTSRLFLSHENQVHGVTGLVALSVQGSEGNFDYLNRNGTLYNEDDDRIMARQNNAHTSYSGLVKLGGTAGKWKWIALADLFVKRQGIPGRESVITEHASLRTLRDAVSLRANRALASCMDLHIGINYLTIEQDFNDLYNEVGINGERTVSAAHAVGGDAVLDTRFTESHQLILRLAARLERYKEQELIAEAYEGEKQSPSDRVRVDAGIEHKWTVFKKVDIVTTLRGAFHYLSFGGGPIHGILGWMPAYTRSDFNLTPALGIRYEIIDGIMLRVNGGRYLRPPDLTELFGSQGSIVGNPQLTAEVGYNADAGITYLFEGRSVLNRLRLDAAWFTSLVDDLIAYVPNSQYSVRPENIEGAMIWGVETAVTVRLFDVMSIQGNYTYLNGRIESISPFHDGNRIPGRPTHEAYGRLELSRGLGQWRLGGFGDVTYVGDSVLDPYNLKNDLVARRQFDVGVWLENRPGRIRLTVKVKNILNEIIFDGSDGRPHPIRDLDGFPLPGRGVFATLNWKV
ncbi:MAG: TonB-dependent receptor [Myxococcota bacterium]|nr:TonB-dependent receptor [Myxococcota bacterium]